MAIPKQKYLKKPLHFCQKNVTDTNVDTKKLSTFNYFAKKACTVLTQKNGLEPHLGLPHFVKLIQMNKAHEKTKIKNLLQKSGLSMNILDAADKLPVQRGFFTNSAGNLLPALGSLGGLHNFCNFVIIFSLM